MEDNSSFAIDVREDNNYGHQKDVVTIFAAPNYELEDQSKKDETHEEQVQPITLSDRLGFEDLFSSKVWRASIGELLGTTTLVFMIDTIIISSYETNTSVPRLIVATLVTITTALLVLATIPVSGGHINPIVSLSAGLMGLISLSRTAIYILAQCTGGVLGALALKAVLDTNLERTFALGGCTVSVVIPGPDGPITTGIDTGRAFLLEVICSFVFLFASRWIAFDQRQAKIVGRITVCLGIGIAAGINVFVSTTITGMKGYSGAGVNPARCFGSAIVRGGHLWNGHWIYWVGPAIASMGFYLYTRIIPDEHFRPNENKQDLVNILKACHTVITSKSWEWKKPQIHVPGLRCCCTSM